MPYEGESAITRFYDGDYAHFRTPSGDVAFYVEEALRAKGPVLELGCGTGRVLIPTAEKGVRITGVDGSEAMLARLRARLPKADVHVGDLRDFDLKRRFALVTIPFRPIAHVLDAADHVRVFENVRRHLAPEGRLLFDFFHPKLAFLTAPRPEKLDFERAEGDLRVRRYSRTTPHVSRQVNDVTLRWEVEHRDGRIEREESRFEMRWFYRFELEHLLARAGFRDVTIYGDFERRPFAADSPDLVAVAR
jgi:SAM-dependent methyltransferase